MDFKIQMVKAIQDGDLAHFKNVLGSQMSWDEYIKMLNNKFNSTKQYHYARLEKTDPRWVENINGDRLDIIVYNKLDPMISAVYQKDENLNINSISSIENFLSELSIKDYTMKCLSNFVGPEAGYYIHKDDNDVFSFQVNGKVEYRIYGKDFPEYLTPQNKTDIPYKSYILEEGDIVFLPKGVYHQVVVLEPRITLISDFFDNLSDILFINQ